jgi:hypothetical protein
MLSALTNTTWAWPRISSTKSTQDECRKRIQENKTCRDKQGRAYWPKVYVTSNSNNEQHERDQQEQQIKNLSIWLDLLKESYEAYENKVEAPPQDGNGGVGYLDATATR